jgi:hypothetical protein
MLNPSHDPGSVKTAASSPVPTLPDALAPEKQVVKVPWLTAAYALLLIVVAVFTVIFFCVVAANAG